MHIQPREERGLKRHNQDERNHNLFPQLPSPLRLRNTHYSISHPLEPRSRTHCARISYYLPCDYPAFSDAMLELARKAVKLARRANNNRPPSLAQSNLHRLVQLDRVYFAVNTNNQVRRCPD